MLHTPPLDMQEGRMCTAHCGCMWLDMVKMNRSLNLHLAPPSLHLKLRPHDLCFLALTPPTPTPDIWPAPAKTNTSRPKRPPLTEAPETQRGGRAHHSEGPVRLAACPAIGCVGQREQSRRQTPDPQESRVRRKAAEHRRWEFAQESPLCRVTEAQMEQGEKERVREREDATLLTHTCRKREGSFTGRQRESCTSPEIHAARHAFLYGHRHSSLIPGNECPKLSCDSLRVNTVPHCHTSAAPWLPRHFIELVLVSFCNNNKLKKSASSGLKGKKRVVMDPVLHHIHASHIAHTLSHCLISYLRTKCCNENVCLKE